MTESLSVTICSNLSFKLLSPVSREECNYIRCLGLNYMDHAKVSFLTTGCLTISTAKGI